MSEGAQPSRQILVLNAGSSSLKFGTFCAEGNRFVSINEGVAGEIGRSDSTFAFNGNEEKTAIPDQGAAFRKAVEALTRASPAEPTAIAHRIVHGGPKLTRHQVLTEAAIGELHQAVPFAPLHLPSALAILQASQKQWPHATQVLCFDTAFHKDMPDISRTLALPAEVRSWGVQRYGFHGLSLESILVELQTVPERLVIAHLGNGCSITAVLNGKSIDTSMGFTPNAGVMMGTRCGDIDPGAVTYIMERGHETPEQLDTLLNSRSGLLGISGLSSDVRDLSAARKNNPQADLALRMFAHQVRKAIASMCAALGGMDLLVFSGGIGEHARDVREEICSGLRFLGQFEARTLPSEEDLQMARIAGALTEVAGQH